MVTPGSGGPSFEPNADDLAQTLQRVATRRRRRLTALAGVVASGAAATVAVVLIVSSTTSSSSLEHLTTDVSPEPSVSAAAAPTAVPEASGGPPAPRPSTPSAAATPFMPFEGESGLGRYLRVLGPDGSPVAGFQAISVFRYDYVARVTGADGRAPAAWCPYVFTVVRAWLPERVASATQPDLAWELIQDPVPVCPPGAIQGEELVVHLKAGGVITGTVYDSQGRPAPGQVVGAECGKASTATVREPGTFSAVSDNQGHYRIPGLNTCDYWMGRGFSYDPFFTLGPTGNRYDVVQVHAGETVHHDITLPPPTMDPTPTPAASPVVEPTTTPTPPPTRSP